MWNLSIWFASDYVLFTIIRITGIAKPITISIKLIVVRNVSAVVTDIPNSITISVVLERKICIDSSKIQIEK